jgi:hypothetical protein
VISCPYPIGGPLSLGPSGTISIVLRRFGGRAIDAPATAQRVVLVLGAIVDTLKGLGLSWAVGILVATVHATLSSETERC